MNGSIKIIKSKTFTTLAVVLILSVVLTAGCSLFGNKEDTSKTADTQEETTNEETASQETETPSVEVDQSLETENEFNSLEKTVENIEGIFNFIDNNIANCNPDFASNMVYTVIRLCEDYKLEFTDEFNDPEVQSTIYELAPSMENLDLEVLKNTDNENVKEIIEEAINKKYKLVSVEGFIMPIVDYQAYYDEYGQYLTAEMDDYLSIKLEESNKPALVDGGIAIPVDDYIQRILKSMEYLENYPDSPRFDEIKQFNNGRILAYLGGIDNTPVFDSDGKIKPEKFAEFQNMLTKYASTEFGEILGSYLDLLEQENYTRTQKIDDFLSNLNKI